MSIWGQQIDQRWDKWKGSDEKSWDDTDRRNDRWLRELLPSRPVHGER